MSKTVVEFTKEELQNLLEDSNSCVSVLKSTYSLALFPYHLGDFSASIKELLNARVAKYEKSLDGILLGYRNVKLLTSEGTIVTDSCHVHIDIEADFYVFKPAVGSVLKGVVNKISGDHVGCLVHNIFNISVPKQDNNEDWVGYLVEIGQEVLLDVLYIDLYSRLPYIRASFDENQFIETEPKKKKKHKNEENEEILENIQEIEQLDETVVHKKKKNKKNGNISMELEENDVSIVKEKKQKYKSTEFSHEYDKDVEKGKKKKNKSKEIITESEINGDVSSVNKDTKNEENVKIKKRHSKQFEETLNGYEESSVSKKKKKVDSIPDSNLVEDHSTPVTHKKSKKVLNTSYENTMADSSDRKNKKNRNSVANGTISWENVTLNLQDSDLEKTLSKSPKEKRKRKKSFSELLDDSYSEEPETKRKKHDDVPEDSPVRKHKSKKKKHDEELEFLKFV